MKAALHASPNKIWLECSTVNVFQAALNGQDESLSSALTVLPSVIESSERSVIIHGRADFVLIAEDPNRAAEHDMGWYARIRKYLKSRLVYYRRSRRVWKDAVGKEVDVL